MNRKILVSIYVRHGLHTVSSLGSRVTTVQQNIDFYGSLCFLVMVLMFKWIDPPYEDIYNASIKVSYVRLDYKLEQTTGMKGL
jgi:hypothetical protein